MKNFGRTGFLHFLLFAICGCIISPPAIWAVGHKVTAGLLGAAGDLYGYSVAIDKDTVIVGVPYENHQEGAAYIYVRGSGGAWSQQAKLTAPDGYTNDQFGVDVDVSGNLVIVGTSKAYDVIKQTTAPGAAYVFVRYTIQGTTAWHFEQKLLPNDAQDFDYFGIAVAIDGNRAAITRAGEPYENISPAAYVFERVCHAECIFPWRQTWKVSRTEQSFGWSVDLSGDTFVVGAPFHHISTMDPNGGAHSIGYHGPSSVYVYRQVNGAWQQDETLQPNDPLNWTPTTLSMLGWSVAIEGTNVVAGAPGVEAAGDSYYPSADDGAAYVYKRNGNVWNKVKKLTPSDASPAPTNAYGVSDAFGHSVGISSGVIVVGSPKREVFHPDNGLTYPDQGSIYLFHRSAGVWIEGGMLSETNGNSVDQFGYSSAIDHGTGVAGIPFDEIYHWLGNNPYTAINQGSALIFTYQVPLEPVIPGGTIGIGP